MKLRSRKDVVILKTIEHRDAYIDRLDMAHVEYDVDEHWDNLLSQDISYIIRIKKADLKKVG